MSIFPTRILLATDGSAEGQLAARTAADLAQRTDSELHVATVGAGLPISATTSPARFEDVLREHRRQAEKVLEQQVKSIEESGGVVNQFAGEASAGAHCYRLLVGRVSYPPTHSRTVTTSCGGE
jgi:nucleotide-binding universal stress UspA family protein